MLCSAENTKSVESSLVVITIHYCKIYKLQNFHILDQNLQDLRQKLTTSSVI